MDSIEEKLKAAKNGLNERASQSNGVRAEYDSSALEDKIQDRKNSMASAQAAAAARAEARLAELKYEISYRKKLGRAAGRGNAPERKAPEIKALDDKNEERERLLNEERELFAARLRETEDLIGDIKRKAELSDNSDSDSVADKKSGAGNNENAAKPEKSLNTERADDVFGKSERSFSKAPLYGFSASAPRRFSEMFPISDGVNEAPNTEAETWQTQSYFRALQEEYKASPMQQALGEEFSPEREDITLDNGINLRYKAEIKPLEKAENAIPCEEIGELGASTVRVVLDRKEPEYYPNVYEIAELAGAPYSDISNMPNAARTGANTPVYPYYYSGSKEAQADPIYRDNYYTDNTDADADEIPYAGVAPNSENASYDIPRGLGDMRLIREYEAARARLGELDGEKPAMTDVPSEVHYADSEAEGISSHTVYDIKEFRKRFKSSEKSVSQYKHRLAKLCKKKSKCDAIRYIEYATEELNILRLILGERAEILTLAVKNSFKKYIKAAKRNLVLSVREYSVAAIQYESDTGVSVAMPNERLAKEILKGGIYHPLPEIHFVEGADLNADGQQYKPNLMSSSERREMRRAQLRDAKLADEEERRLKRLASHGRAGADSDVILDDEIKGIEEKIERDRLYVSSRVEYNILELKSRREMLDASYSVKYSDINNGYRELTRRMKKLTKLKSRAVKEEERDAERHYAALFAERDLKKPIKKSKRLKFESLQMRLDGLLKEKEALTENLIKLYTGENAKGDKNKAEKKLFKVRKKHARRVKRRLAKEMRVIESRIPLDIKEKLVNCANKIIDTEARIEDAKYRLKKQKLAKLQRKEQKMLIKRSSKQLRVAKADFKYFLKKARKYKERNKTARSQILWVILLLVIIGGIVGGYFLLKSRGILQ